MSFDWAHQYCLGCDKQTDGATYCSESCRLADYEKTSTSGSQPSSPAMASPFRDWAFGKLTRSSSTTFHASTYDFGVVQSALVPSGRTLSPSNSYTSLCSIKSISSSTSESSQAMCENATKELRAYNRSLESVRLQRRRSY